MKISAPEVKLALFANPFSLTLYDWREQVSERAIFDTNLESDDLWRAVAATDDR